MDPQELRQRTKQFGLRIIRLVNSLPRDRTADVIGRQLLRSGISVSANYRAACRAKSTADFISKMGTVEEETDEAMHWMEMLVDSGIMKAAKLGPLMKEADELLAITVTSITTARKRKRTTRSAKGGPAAASPQSPIRNPKSGRNNGRRNN